MWLASDVLSKAYCHIIGKIWKIMYIRCLPLTLDFWKGNNMNSSQINTLPNFGPCPFSAMKIRAWTSADRMTMTDNMKSKTKDNHAQKIEWRRTLFSTVHYDMSSLPTLQSLGQRRGPKWPKGTNEILKPSRGVLRRSRTWWWHWVSWGITSCGWKLSHCCDPSGGQAGLGGLGNSNGTPKCRNQERSIEI